jgi:hypothetical protein
LAAVFGGFDDEVAVDGVAEEDTVLFVGEGDGVPEALGVGVGAEELPGGAAVAGAVEAGFLAGAGGEQDGAASVEGFDIPEVEGFGAGDGAALPGGAVGGEQDGAAGAAGPGGAGVDGSEAAEAGVDAAGLGNRGWAASGRSESRARSRRTAFRVAKLEGAWLFDAEALTKVVDALDGDGETAFVVGEHEAAVLQVVADEGGAFAGKVQLLFEVDDRDGVADAGSVSC